MDSPPRGVGRCRTPARCRLGAAHCRRYQLSRTKGAVPVAERIVVPDLWTGRCQCGDHAYEASGIPDDPHLCSCEHCTRLSGSPAMAWVGFHRDALKWTAWQESRPTSPLGRLFTEDPASAATPSSPLSRTART
ncbi:GFA family protein [Streptomyces fagopyri]|uniref:GFA family protein n=1 Tax=Streptomyces fagopyri TaxID=2662397 RepID=UPI003F4CD254